MKRDLPRLMLAAPRSGTGKTTLTCGLLQLFKQMNLHPAAFKTGPDYIDPLFHRKIVGAKSGNLDLFFTSEDVVRSLLMKETEDCGVAVLEGVMGFYDGISGMSTEGSSYALAVATGTPVIFVLDIKGASLSLAAQIHGFATFRSDANIQGVILNKCSEKMYDYLKAGLEKETGLKILGYVPEDEDFTIGSRHLGLITAEEISDLQVRLGTIADTLATTLDVEALLEIAESAPAVEYESDEFQPVTTEKLRLAVAQDKAFCFYYEENLKMLGALGVELVEFSPVAGDALPENVDGLYLGGGYPELHGQALQENDGLRQEIRSAIEGGLPTVAECGGFMYLQEQLVDPQGKSWEMVGALPGVSENTGRLQRFGYITVTAQADNMYCKKGESIRAHEFHYWNSENNGSDFHAKKPLNERNWQCTVATDHLVAGFPHLYYPANPDFARNFVAQMEKYKLQR